MEEQLALRIADQMDEWRKSNPVKYEIDRLMVENRSLKGFHQWVNGKQVMAGYDVRRIEDNERYFLLFIDWHRNSNYYLVVYNAKKTTTVCEIQTVIADNDGSELVWKYNPLKRDGKNAERKAYFRALTGSTSIHIPLPQTNVAQEMDSFMDHLFKLCKLRLRADKVVDIFKEVE